METLEVPFLSSIVDCAMRMPAVSPVTALVGGGVMGWMCFGGAGVGFSAVLIGLVIFSGVATSFGLGGGSVFCLVTTGAGAWALGGGRAGWVRRWGGGR